MEENRLSDLTQTLSKVLVEQGLAGLSGELLARIYAELRRQASGIMAKQNIGHTLQPTALVNEACIRLLAEVPWWTTEAHFFNAAAAVMRRILVEHARGKGRVKRGGAAARASRVSISDSVVTLVAASEGDPANLIDIDEAITELQAFDPRRGEIVNLKFFGGLDDAAIGELLGCDERTVRRDWKATRLWLARRLGDERSA